MIAVSIDIGSTWTKGALFEVEGAELSIRQRATCPTTTDHLARGFLQVLTGLLGHEQGLERIRSGEIRLSYSSSAKGGLAVAALGLVPSITLESARVAAYSAGAKITQVFSYRLTASDVRALERNPPDILLFAGGTDGGHVEHVLANAARLADSSLDCSIVYAGNRVVRDEVQALLTRKDIVAVDNVLPSLDCQNPDPAREAMRALFLSRIVKGKGLDEIIALTGAEPLPTPYAMYEYVRHIRERVPGWEDFILLDMGGATTDVYSAHQQMPSAGAVMRGLPEPLIKRTVEGDLGMRVSAMAARESARALIAEGLEHQPQQLAAFDAYIEKIAATPDYLPEDAQGRAFDTLLAGACTAHACERHAGRASMVYTCDGPVEVQSGRNLTSVTRVIGSGGWLSRVRDFDLGAWLKHCAVDAHGKSVLLPRQVDYFRDQDYLFPMLANLARDFPLAAALAGTRMLTH